MNYIIKNKSNTIRILSLMGFFILILLSGCRKDRVSEDPSDPTFPTPGTMIESRLEGMINDETGDPIQGVTISVEGNSATTDDDGFFRFAALSLKSTGSVATSTKDGYINGIKTVYPHLKGASFMELTLIKTNAPKKFSSSTGGTITTNGNGTIVFSPDGIVLKSGGSYSGEVEVYTHWYDPADPNTPVTMPGNLEGRDESGARFQLQTFGMLYVDLKAPDGRSLQLADGKEATINFPAINSATAPTTLPLWSFDEANGLWVKEGEATLDGDQYVGQVSHFSFWNCDYNFPLVTIEGRVVDEATGNPIANQGVAIRVNQWMGGYGYTNSAGIFKGKVPKNQPLELVIWDCGVLLVQQSLGTLSADENLGNFEVTLTDFAFPITGKMVGCAGEILPQAYGVIHRELVTSAPDGTFNTITSGCGQSTVVGIFSNPVEQSSKIIDIPTDQSMVDLRDVELCGQKSAYVSFTIDGDYYSLGLTPEATFIDDRIDIRNISANTDGVKFAVDLPSQEVGTHNPTNASLYSLLYFSGQDVITCNDNNPTSMCDDFTITLDNTGTVGDTITGTFAGKLEVQKDTGDITPFPIVDIVGSFKIPIVDDFNSATIKGRVWVDENEDGIQDTGEDLVVSATFTPKNSNGSSPKFGIYNTTDTDGNYEITGLKPGEYRVHASGPWGSEISPKNATSDDLDNDFNNFTNWETDIITLGDGEVVDHVDLGVSVPGFKLSGFGSSGCIPNLKLNIYTIGGTLPITYQLSDGQVSQNRTFNIMSGGNYMVTATDAIGREVQSGVTSIYDYNNGVHGIVWEDEATGLPNVYDSGDDTKLKDVIVKLYTDSGNLVDNIVTGSVSAGFLFQNIPPGMYYIEVEKPSGLEWVDKDFGATDSYNSHIDPSTNRSDIFEIVDCNEYMTINGGLK